MTHTNAHFVFDLNFDLPTNGKLKIDEPIALPIIYSKDDLDASYNTGIQVGHAQGFEEGFVQGELKAITRRQLEIKAAFIKIYESLDILLKKEEIFESYIQQTVVSLMKTIVTKAFPHYCQHHNADEMVNGIENILKTVIDSQQIRIYVSPSILSDVEEKILDIQNRFQHKVTLLADPNVQNADCKLEWKGGGARWRQSHLLESIEALLETSLSTTHINSSNH